MRLPHCQTICCYETSGLHQAQQITRDVCEKKDYECESVEERLAENALCGDEIEI